MIRVNQLRSAVPIRLAAALAMATAGGASALPDTFYSDVLHKTNSDGKRLIGSGVLYRPQVAFFAKHASAQEGNIVWAQSGACAVVLATAGAPAPDGVKKELQIALLDRPIGEGHELFRHPDIERDGGVRFEEGQTSRRVSLAGLRYQYAGYPTGKGGLKLSIAEFDFGDDAHFTVYRGDGVRAAKTYPADSPSLFYGEMYGPFEGKGGQSGGPTFIGGRLAGIHWRKQTDDYVGDGAVRGWLEKTIASWGSTVDGFCAKGGRLEAVPDEAKGRPVATFTPEGKHDRAVGFPWNVDPARGRKGTVVQWAGRFSGDFEISVSVSTTDKTSARGKRRFVFRPVDPGGPAAEPADGDDGRVIGLGTAAGDGEWHSFRFDLAGFLRESEPANSIEAIQEFSVKGTGAFTGVSLGD